MGADSAAGPKRTGHRRRRSPGATIRQVAKAAGVSTATVSRVFSGAGGVRSTTRERVLNAARDARYRPNPAARSLARGSTGLLGIVVPDLTHPGEAHFVQAAMRRAQTEGFSLAVADWVHSPAEVRPLVAEMAQRTDGLLLCAPALLDRECAVLAETAAVVLARRRVPTPADRIGQRAGAVPSRHRAPARTGT